jgi:hypothetical protein
VKVRESEHAIQAAALAVKLKMAFFRQTLAIDTYASMAPTSTRSFFGKALPSA